MIRRLGRKASLIAPVSAATTSGASSGTAARWTGLLPPPSRNEPLLLTGSIKGLANADWGSIALVTFTAAVGIMALCGAFQGWLFKKTPWYERLMLLVAGVLLVYPKTLFDAIGFVLVAMVLVGQWFRKPLIKS